MIREDRVRSGCGSGCHFLPSSQEITLNSTLPLTRPTTRPSCRLALWPANPRFLPNSPPSSTGRTAAICVPCSPLSLSLSFVLSLTSPRLGLCFFGAYWLTSVIAITTVLVLDWSKEVPPPFLEFPAHFLSAISPCGSGSSYRPSCSRSSSSCASPRSILSPMTPTLDLSFARASLHSL